MAYAAALTVAERGDDVRPNVADAAIGVELIHTYSLIHDDLPIMDDDDMRRNMPSCHKKFGEANAILAGDMLQVLAFDRLIKNNDYDLQTKYQMFGTLVHAALEMVSGQALDITGEQSLLPPAKIERMYELKTASLITAALKLGALSGRDCSEVLPNLAQAGKKIGVAFQIQDDILDLAEEPREKGKSTYPNAAGIAVATQRKNELHSLARADIDGLDERADFLRYLFDLMCDRQE